MEKLISAGAKVDATSDEGLGLGSHEVTCIEQRTDASGAILRVFEWMCFFFFLSLSLYLDDDGQ